MRLELSAKQEAGHAAPRRAMCGASVLPARRRIGTTPAPFLRRVAPHSCRLDHGADKNVENVRAFPSPTGSGAWAFATAMSPRRYGSTIMSDCRKAPRSPPTEFVADSPGFFADATESDDGVALAMRV